MGQWIKDKISGFFGGIFGGIKKLLGISSPSKKFAEIGVNMAMGLGEGFSDEMDKVGKKINSSIPTEIDTGLDINGRVNSGVYGFDYGRLAAALGDVLFGVFEALPEQAVVINIDGTKLGRVNATKNNCRTTTIGVE